VNNERRPSCESKTKQDSFDEDCDLEMDFDDEMSIEEENTEISKKYIIEHFMNCITDLSIDEKNALCINHTNIKLDENYQMFENTLINSFVKEIDNSITKDKKPIENVFMTVKNLLCSNDYSYNSEKDGGFKFIRRTKKLLFSKIKFCLGKNILQNMEKEVSNRFADKWNASKVIAKHKKNSYKKDLNTEIKSKEEQQENIQKFINYNQKEIKKLNKLLEEANEEKLTNELKEINDKIYEIQNDIKRLNKIKLEHKLCQKNINILKCNLNVANNELEFEFKKSNMMTLPKKEPTKISNPSISLIYGEKIRNKSLQNTKVKFSSKLKILKYKNFNFLTNEYKDNIIMPHKNLIKNKLKTTENLDSSNIFKYLKNEINCKIDASTPKLHLFSESEKKVIQKLLPTEFFNHINEKYNQAENKLVQIEEKFKGNNKLKSEIDLENVKNDELNLQLKRNKIVRNDLNLDISKNNKKILEIRNKIKEVNDNIKRQDLNLYRKSIINEKIKEQINELKNRKKEPLKVDAMN
jgi:hypothetical protein